ncbi:hypothetical protein [Leifsonia sp. SIMBA_070]|uniref:hypothetical protein n=1 Tax=Leifsonia sp. SIMBA_070 TaxID=3085810 RepID=UPI00397ABF45
MREPGHDRADTSRALGEVVGQLSLLALLEEAVAAAEQAELLLDRCDGLEATTPADARAALRLRIAFAGLQHWVDDLELGGQEAEVQDETGRLLAFYLHLLTHAFDRRIAAAGRDRLAIRGRGPLTGVPAQRLARLRDRLRAGD